MGFSMSILRCRLVYVAVFLLLVPTAVLAIGGVTKQGTFETYRTVVTATQAGVLSTTVLTVPAKGFVVLYACIDGGDFWVGSTLGRFPLKPAGCAEGVIVAPPAEVISCSTLRDVQPGHVMTCLLSGVAPDTWGQ
jgi:hypothetical protein